MIIPASAAGKLGLDVLEDRLAALTLSDAAREKATSWGPIGDLEAVRAELARVSELAEAIEFDDPLPLKAVPDLQPALERSRPEGAALDFGDLNEIRRAAETSRLVRSFFERRASKYPAVWASVNELEDTVQLEDGIRAAVDDAGTLRDDASAELRRIRSGLSDARTAARNHVAKALAKASNDGYAAEDQPTIRGGRMVIPIRAEAKRKIEGFVHDVSSTGQTVYIEPAGALEMNNRVRELELEESREIERIRRRLTDLVRSARGPLGRNIHLLHELDFRRAKARLSSELDAVVPEVGADGIIDFTGGRNPALVLHFARLGGDRTVVPLDFRIGADVRTVVISGPNAGGKSVAMKAVGLMAAMIGRGMPVPVDPGSRFDLFSPIFVDIGDEQSLADDLSTFTSHMRNLARVLEEANDDSLVLMDEAGTGTDPDAGGAVAQAALERLTACGARTIVTTHYGSLKVFAHETDGVENASMEFDRERLAPTYRFQPGMPGSSYASEIADRVGLPESITKRARELLASDRLRAEDLIRSLEERTAELDRKLTELSNERARIDEHRGELESRVRRLQEERDDIRAEAHAEADRILSDANRAVERTIREIRESEAEKERTRQARERLESDRERLDERADRVDRRRRSRRDSATRPQRTPDAGDGERGNRQKPTRESADDPIAEGDRVRIDDQQTVGEVVSVSEREAVVAFGSMQLRTDPSRLTKVGSRPEQKVTVRHSGQGGRLSVQDVKRRIDIRGQRVNEAVGQVTAFLDRAMAAGLDRVEILHGKGTGALRRAVQEYLDTYAGVTGYEDAPWEEGGPGVTIVNLGAAA
ncbi:MAG: endonuclease MutS2 [Rhodothermales bacterium]|nr:endonuclease MutS2 [Rhodothermales bacterium]